MPCSASSTAIPETKKVQHEALLRVAAPGGCVGHSLGSGWNLPGPRGSGPVSLAQAETLLRDPLCRPQTQAPDRLFHHWPDLLHTKGNVEVELVLARLWV